MSKRDSLSRSGNCISCVLELTLSESVLLILIYFKGLKKEPKGKLQLKD